MPRILRIALSLFLPLLIGAPLAILVTVATAPFWEWLEATIGVQAYGHHGPVEWCYVVTFAVLVGFAYALLVAGHRRRVAPADPRRHSGS